MPFNFKKLRNRNDIATRNQKSLNVNSDLKKAYCEIYMLADRNTE